MKLVLTVLSYLSEQMAAVKSGRFKPASGPANKPVTEC